MFRFVYFTFYHYENLSNFLALKIENFQLKDFDIFIIFAQNIDCGYMLEPPCQRGGGYSHFLWIHRRGPSF